MGLTAGVLVLTIGLGASEFDDAPPPTDRAIRRLTRLSMVRIMRGPSPTERAEDWSVPPFSAEMLPSR